MAEHRIRILTLNCLFRNKPRARLKAIAAGLRAIGADVSCLQEVIVRRNVALLGGAPLVYQPWGLIVKGGLVTLTADPIESMVFEVYRIGVWFEWGARKGFLTTAIRHDGVPVTVVNTHLLANYNQDWSPTNGYARRQVVELEQLAAALARLPSDRLLIVAGDFNVPGTHPMLSKFIESTGLRSAVDWSLFPESRGNLAIDNVLYRPPAGGTASGTARLHFENRVTLADGTSAFPSDHVGVEATIEW